MHAYKKDGGDEKTYHCNRCDGTYPASTLKTSQAVYRGEATIQVGDFFALDEEHQGDGEGHCSYVYITDPDATVTIRAKDLGDIENVWQCGDDCFHHDEPVPDFVTKEIWVCDECGEEYDSEDYDDPAEAKQDAVNCCKEGN